MLVSILIFVGILGLLVFVHELGHFWAAKKAGAKVEEFGFGFPPRIFGIKRGETTYSVNWIPLGGFVKILGEDGENKKDPRSFSSQTFWWKVIILVAGVTMNMLLAMVLLAIGFKIGLPTVIDETTQGQVTDAKLQIIEVAQDSPAQQSGFQIGDEVVELDGILMTETPQFQQKVSEFKGKEVEILVKHPGEEEVSKLTVTPRENPPEGQGSLGVSLAKTGIIKYGWIESLWRGIVASFTLCIAIVLSFGDMIRNLISGSGAGVDVAGPVGIAVMTNQAAKLGISNLLQFAALLSVNLAIINILPFPALDGGRLLLVVIEKIRKKPLDQKIEGIIHTSGFIFLLAVMVVVTFRDIFRFRDIFERIWQSITELF